MELLRTQDRLTFDLPILEQLLLRLDALEFVEFFAHWLGRTLVARAHLFVHRLNQLNFRGRAEPRSNAFTSFSRGCGAKSPTGECIQLFLGIRGVSVLGHRKKLM